MAGGQRVRAAQTEAIRVGLEVRCDAEHVDGWLLDYPGCSFSSSDQTAAVACVPAAAGRFAAWLAAHGESITVPATEWVDIVEEVATVVVDGDVRAATFAADRRPALADEVEAALRWLDLARGDLLALLPRIEAWQAVNGPLPTLGQPRGWRTVGRLCLGAHERRRAAAHRRHGDVVGHASRPRAL
jgi:hypothetical protein